MNNINDYMVFSILNTLCCCFVFGIVAIIYSAQVYLAHYFAIAVRVQSIGIYSVKPSPSVNGLIKQDSSKVDRACYNLASM